MVIDSEYMIKREQNYMFAYKVVPSIIYHGDSARSLVTGKTNFQGAWHTLAAILPHEQRVSEEDCSEEDLMEEKYQLSDGVYCLLLSLPPAERYLEVQFIAIVFQPKLSCFVVGKSGLDAESKHWSIREVSAEGHAKCGHLTNLNVEGFLEEVNRILGLPPKIRRVDAAEFAAQEASVETFVVNKHKFFQVLMIAATYNFISQYKGSSAGYSESVVAEFLNSSSDEVKHAISGLIFFVLDIDQPATGTSDVSA